MTETPISPCPEYAAAFNCFREAMAWGCEPEDAMASALEEYRSASYAELSRLRSSHTALVAALEWYGEQSRLCRLIHSEGDAGRNALAADGGERARAALSAEGEKDAPKDDEPRKWPVPGDKMRFLGKNGYDRQLAHAKSVLEVGQILTVKSCDVGEWNHSIRFEEYDYPFNGVMFERVNPGSCRAPKDDGWIEWKGGECPVRPDQRVDVRLRSGQECFNDTPDWNWGACAHGGDIIAYRVVKP